MSKTLPVDESSNIKPFRLYTSTEYYKQLSRSLEKVKAQDRVLVSTMDFKPELPETVDIMDKLCIAAKRGAEVTFIVDAYIFLLGRGLKFGPLFFHNNLPAKMPSFYSKRLAALDKLKSCGGQYYIINKPERRFKNPYSGRSHIKLAIINDYVYIGGANVSSIQGLDIDIMVGKNEKVMADKLAGIMKNIAIQENAKVGVGLKDRLIHIDSNSDLLIDAGEPGRSLILEQALSLIDEAKESIFITCQYFPNAATARHLAQAHARGVTLHVLYNHPSKRSLPFNLLHHCVVFVERIRNPSVLFKDVLPKDTNFLHAKLLVTEQATMVGSHNFVEAGVRFGTAEIALLSKDRNFAKNAVDMINRQLQRQE